MGEPNPLAFAATQAPNALDALDAPPDIPDLSVAIDPLDVPVEEGEQGGEAPPAPAASTPAPALTDPLEIPVERSRPPSVAEQPVPGVYVAVFEGLVSVSNALGEVLVGVGQGAYVPLLPTAVPRALPASPVFMERDPELDRSRLYPEMCMR